MLKRDRSTEQFDVRKLSVAMWRAMGGSNVPYDYARKLGEAIEVYMLRRKGAVVSSLAIFEMALKVFRHVGIPAAADRAESYFNWRKVLRNQLRIMYNDGRLTFWDKSWLCEFAVRSWHISPVTARILAGRIEVELLRVGDVVVERQKVVDALNRMISEYGLADAVPVGH